MDTPIKVIFSGGPLNGKIEVILDVPVYSVPVVLEMPSLTSPKKEELPPVIHRVARYERTKHIHVISHLTIYEFTGMF